MLMSRVFALQIGRSLHFKLLKPPFLAEFGRKEVGEEITADRFCSHAKNVPPGINGFFYRWVLKETGFTFLNF